MALTSFHLLRRSVNFYSESTHLISLRQFTLRAPRWHLRGRKSFKRTIKEMFECSCMLAPALPLSSVSLSLSLSLSLSCSSRGRFYVLLRYWHFSKFVGPLMHIGSKMETLYRGYRHAELIYFRHLFSSSRGNKRMDFNSFSFIRFFVVIKTLNNVFDIEIFNPFREKKYLADYLLPFLCSYLLLVYLSVAQTVIYSIFTTSNVLLSNCICLFIYYIFSACGSG
jgi:hypothetical protein